MANTIQDKLAYLEETKGLIKQAIAAKGVSVSDEDTFRSYANKIEAIQSGGGTVNLPDGTKFAYSTFTTVTDSIISYLETQNDMSHMFDNCSYLTSVSQFSTSSVTDMSYMFYNCSYLTSVPLFSTSSVTNMSYMFYYCRQLTSVPLFDTSSVTDMRYMFQYCFSLTSVPQFSTSSVTDMSYMFYNCTKLTSVPLLNFSSVNNNYNMFGSCSSLTNLGGFIGLKENLKLPSSPLTVDSVMNIINYAADMTSSPKTLTLNKNVFNKLSSEQIATATAKGWNIASK